MKMRVVITALGLSLLLMSGCASKSAPNRFYTLNAIPIYSMRKGNTKWQASHLRLMSGVGTEESR